MVKPPWDSRHIAPDVLNAQRTRREDTRVHAMSARVSYPIGVACFALMALIAGSLGGAWKNGRMVVFFQSCCPKGMFKEKAQINASEKCQIDSFRSEALHLFAGCPRFICWSCQPSIFLSTKWILCFLNCPRVSKLLSPASETDSGSANGGKKPQS